MREIKFRAWDKATREYWNIDKWHFEDEYLDLIEPGVSICDSRIKRIWRKRRDVELMQYTGLKDVNGKDIYEGDIVKFFGANKKIKAKNEFGIIIYKADRYGAGFNSIIQNKEHGYGGINIAQDIVVGNVHENPELLEEEL